MDASSETRPTSGSRTSAISIGPMRLGAVIVAVILGGRFVASNASDLSDLGAPFGPSSPSLTETDPVRAHLLERLDHSVVNLHSTAHESDLPGASIAEYGMRE